MTIVPSTKLIILAAAIFLPLSILAAVMPLATGPGVGLMGVLVVLAAVDAAVSRDRLDGVRVSLLEVVRVSVGRETELTLSIDNKGLALKRLRLGLSFPRQIYSPNSDLVSELPAEATSSIICWPFKALKQGLYLLDNCHL